MAVTGAIIAGVGLGTQIVGGIIRGKAEADQRDNKRSRGRDRGKCNLIR